MSKNKLTYLRYSDDAIDNVLSTGDILTSITPSAYKIMPYDNLFIRVITPDPQWAALFNIETGTTGLTQESAGLSGYSVDPDGFIEIPYVGKVKVAGQTLSEVKVELDSIFKNYVSDAAISIRLVNNAVSIIGEVKNPGRYILFKDRINIFEALSLAGDLSEYSNRQKVQLIRPSPYGPIIKEFSLGDRSILTSEFYYVMPNDIIYAVPIRARSFQVNSSVYALFLSVITTALVVISYFRVL
ncbi:MAG: polysaccharide biosynthesis/export family protein [Bacteroidia bacterium]|nr:polysaccharide biosynthesis/export family protein [Bacteroidia bacterium]